jgi:hypothetical protein
VLGLKAMSFDHKAFEFAWPEFAQQLLPTLSRSLEHNETESLQGFIAANLAFCRNPYSGAALSPSWESSLEVGDVQELGDFALTRYYNPIDDHGLGSEWLTIEQRLSASEKAALLGSALLRFDPGRQGSYFQTASQAAASARLLGTANLGLTTYQSFLTQAASKGLGVYVTF